MYNYACSTEGAFLKDVLEANAIEYLLQYFINYSPLLVTKKILDQEQMDAWLIKYYIMDTVCVITSLTIYSYRLPL